MPDHDDQSTLKISGPDAFAQLVPHLIGFTPEESLVISVIQHGRIGLTARVDLAEMQPAGEVEDLLDRIWTRFPDAGALLTAYTSDQRAGWSLLGRCTSYLPSGAAHLTMVVDGDTWHLPDGQTGAIDPFGRIAAEASYHGLQRLPSRADLAATFASPPDSAELSARVDAALDALPDPTDRDAVIAHTSDLIRRNLSTGGIDPHDAVQLGVLSQHGQARELALLAMTHHDANQHLALWRTVVNHVPEHGAEPPLFLAGMAAWIAGEGAAVSVALERLEQLGQDNQFQPALILDRLVHEVTPPTAWDALRTDGLAIAAPAIRDAVAAIHTPTTWETIPKLPLNRSHQPPAAAPPAPGIAI